MERINIFLIYFYFVNILLIRSIPRLVPFPFALLTLRSLRTNQTRRGWMRKGRERIRTG